MTDDQKVERFLLFLFEMESEASSPFSFPLREGSIIYYEASSYIETYSIKTEASMDWNEKRRAERRMTML
jgi:hypothetical protein